MRVLHALLSFTKFIHQEILCNINFARGGQNMDNINEYIYYFFMKDEEALQELIRLLRPMSVALIKERFSSYQMDHSLFQEYLIESDQLLIDCLYRCRVDLYGSFRSFYRRALKNRLIDLGRFRSTHTLEIHYEIVQLDKMVREDIQHYVADIIEDPLSKTHQDVMIAIEKQYIQNEMKRHFSGLENKVIQLRSMGYTVREISDLLHISIRKVRYIILKVKKWYTAH